MIEIRNDLITEEAGQFCLGGRLAQVLSTGGPV
jgi:predicted N-formylglutamate amidohydrolase